MLGDSESRIFIRQATSRDIPDVVRLRRRMYEDMQYTDVSALEQSARLNETYLQKAIPEGSFRAWLACHDAQVIASAAVLISPWPAHPYDQECRRATILNVCTDPAYRRRGIARQLMVTIIAWCKREGFARVSLHASEAGRHLYESLGFEATNEMRLKLR
jgi:ribosomal protein S18 acetylase RimI-like enzyme